jgi:hypothetical protein
VSSGLGEKEVEQKVVHHLERMKQLMSKNVIINDFVYDQMGEEANELRRLVDRMDSFRDSMQAKAQQYSKAVQECLTHLQLNSRNQIS